jgi:iron complex transport system ATP-binding protein
MVRLRCDGLSVGYEGRTVLHDLDIALRDGEITAIIGANGSGKSTLLRSLARVLRPLRGTVLLDGRAIHRRSTREVARLLALLPQGVEAPEGLRVSELVAYGRYPYQTGFGVHDADDRRAVDWAMDVTRTGELADRTVDSLSGGERQRAWIAMALAQETDILLLDEPTTALDLRHQIETLDLVRRLNETREMTIVMVLHDVNHAARYAHRVVALGDGGIVAEGAPVEVLTADTLSEVYGVRADILMHERTGALLCVPYGTLGEYRV